MTTGRLGRVFPTVLNHQRGVSNQIKLRIYLTPLRTFSPAGSRVLPALEVRELTSDARRRTGPPEAVDSRRGGVSFTCATPRRPPGAFVWPQRVTHRG